MFTFPQQVWVSHIIAQQNPNTHKYFFNTCLFSETEQVQVGAHFTFLRLQTVLLQIINSLKCFEPLESKPNNEQLLTSSTPFYFCAKFSFYIFLYRVCTCVLLSDFCFFFLVSLSVAAFYIFFLISGQFSKIF